MVSRISVHGLISVCGFKGWHGIMYECVWTSFRMAFVYFVVYIFTVTIVFTSLFVSLIFALYGTMETQRRAGQLFLTLTNQFGVMKPDSIPVLMGQLLEIDFTDEAVFTSIDDSNQVDPAELELQNNALFNPGHKSKDDQEPVSLDKTVTL